jgi:hypothetical protein
MPFVLLFTYLDIMHSLHVAVSCLSSYMRRDKEAAVHRFHLQQQNSKAISFQQYSSISFANDDASSNLIHTSTMIHSFAKFVNHLVI